MRRAARPDQPRTARSPRLSDPAERFAVARDLARRYEGGASIREISEATGRSFGQVHKLLEEAGVPMRSRGGSHRRNI